MNKLSLLFLCMMLATAGCQQSENATMIGHHQALTEKYGNEVLRVIEDTLWKMKSPEFFDDPSFRTELLTGPYLNTFSTHSSNPDVVYVTTSLEFEGVRVFEYSSQEFRAIVCGTSYLDQVTDEGELIKSMPPHKFRNLYIFANENGTWKMALQVGLDTAYDDWGYAADWERELVGDIELYIHADCFDLP